MGRRWAVVAAVAILGVAAGCSDDGEGSDVQRPLVDQIQPAIEAVEAALGGAQSYFEINATPQLVNLFVADGTSDTVVPYVFAGDELQEPGPSSPVSGGTPFVAEDLTTDFDGVLAGVTAELENSDISVFVIYADAAGVPRYGATVVSSEGGVLDVELGPTGEVLAVDPRS